MNKKTERAVDKFSSFYFLAEKANNKLLRHFLGFWVLFSDSLAFSPSIALFFVPKDPLGPDFGPKQNFKKAPQHMFWIFLSVLGRVFRFSGAFCVDCALFRPNRPPGARFWTKTKSQRKT